MLLAGKTLNIFILTGLSNINVFFIQRKMNVVVYSNIYDKFSSTNLMHPQKLKKKSKNIHYNFF